jgi:hypothetical protein
MKFLFASLGVLMMYVHSAAQPGYSALDTVPPYLAPFGYGVNVGAYPPWRDENLANIAAGNEDLNLSGIGITAFRPELPELFVEYWGYDIRVEAFRHYRQLGMRNHVLFIGQPSPLHRDSTFYCTGEMSKLFKNLYLPIWDDGADGTAVNDSNYFARYVYLLCVNYGDDVRFWEVWNEPDLDLSGLAIAAPGEPGNWWENNPGPCETPIFAPVQHYVRMLRIAYEVIKTLHPEDYVAVGGLGNMSYLDAILRNSDNPADGSITADYPLTGGAYFDCMSFHSYPHLDGSMRYWDNVEQRFGFLRHSDKAIDGMLWRRDAMERVLFKYGFDGYTFPAKEWILTETNLPRRAFADEYFGSDHIQRNFAVKALVACQMNHIRQFDIYSLADVEPDSVAKYEFETMGLFKSLSGIQPHTAEPNEVGIAYATTSQVLRDYTYDSLETVRLLLPAGVRGAAFRSEGQELTYVLWAQTQFDRSEQAYAIFSLPENLNISRLKRRFWDYAATGYADYVSPDTVHLIGDPIFFSPEFNTDSPAPAKPAFAARIVPNPFREMARLDLELTEPEVLSATVLSACGQWRVPVFEEKPVPAGQMSLSLPANDLPPGMYFLRLVGRKVTNQIPFIRIR